jgi:putative methionine-R-sulfoxide reductase with GAF domain
MALSSTLFPDIEAVTAQFVNLLNETDVENQLGNIEKWLKLHFPIKGVGLSISASDFEFGHFLSKKINPADLEKILNRFENSSSNERVHAGIMMFAGTDGDIRPIDRVENIDVPEPAESGGLAFGLQHQDNSFGTLIVMTDKDSLLQLNAEAELLQWFRSVFANLFYNTSLHHQNIEKLRLLNLYETVSSALCYTGDLQELLTTIISIIVTELPSEEGSILLYDSETNELEFFSAIGETGSGFVQCRFPADKGIAGKALQDGQPVIVNNVQTCPYFFNNFDDQSGFKTQSILATPIISGREKVGVIEAINKQGTDCFDEKDKRTLMAIADEIGLAVKNARMFEHVVNSYCKIRQGQMSCKGCVRPLKSWTPCARQLDMV